MARDWRPRTATLSTEENTIANTFVWLTHARLATEQIQNHSLFPRGTTTFSYMPANRGVQYVTKSLSPGALYRLSTIR